MWSLADPLLLLLLPLPLALVLLPAPPPRAAGAALRVPDGFAARFGVGGATGAAERGRAVLPWLVWIALILALAGPQRLTDRLATTTGRDLVLALDVSGSMVREDFALDGKEVARLDALKHVATGFVRGRGGDRLALILFGSKAYFATPQTFDVNAVAHAVRTAEIGISGRATGIGDALGLAIKRLVPGDATARVVILLSDGVNNAGPVRPRDAAALAAEKGIRIHTIAMGPLSMAEAGGSTRESVDAATLADIARLSGGETFRVRSTADLEAAVAAIDGIEALREEGPTVSVHRDLWPWPAGFALVGFVLIALRDGWPR